MPAARWRSPRLFPLAAAPLLATLGALEAALDAEYRLHHPVLVAVALWIAASFVVASRWPAAGLLCVSGFFPLTLALGAPGPGGTGLIAVLLACGWAGYAVDARRSLLAASGAVVVFVATDLTWHGLAWDTIFFPAVFYPGRWAGTLVRRERERSAQLLEMAAALDAQREAAASAAVNAERTRIAREVHDAVAHSVSVMTLQIGGLRRQLDDVLATRTAERDVMLGLERLGRQSVEELRSLVGILRESGTSAPTAAVPSLAAAPDLVADVRAAGLEVTLAVEGEVAELPRALDVSAYRILQEALTNVLRHSPGSRASVTVRHAPGSVDLIVGDDGSGRKVARGLPHGEGVGGHGLVGMKERVAMFGGTLKAGQDGSGFRVHAHLPTSGRWT